MSVHAVLLNGEACRYNKVELLLELISGDGPALALISSCTISDGVGTYCLHIFSGDFRTGPLECPRLVGEYDFDKNTYHGAEKMHMFGDVTIFRSGSSQWAYSSHGHLTDVSELDIAAFKLFVGRDGSPLCIVSSEVKLLSPSDRQRYAAGVVRNNRHEDSSECDERYLVDDLLLAVEAGFKSDAAVTHDVTMKR